MAKDSTGTILLVGVAGVGVYGYFAGWFNSILAQFGIAAPGATPATTSLPTQTVTPAQLAALQMAAQGGAAPMPGTTTAAAAVPALGTMVTTAAQAAQQAAANDPWIVFGGALIGTSPPANYQLFNTSDLGNIWVRNDIVTAANAWLATQQAQANAACSAWALTNPNTPCPASVPSMTLAQLQQIKTGAGLSGLGDYQRHVYSRTGRIGRARVA